MSSVAAGRRSVVVTLGPAHQYPWWWSDIRRDEGLCPLDYLRIDFRGKKSHQIGTIELPVLMWQLLLTLISLRKKYDHVFTFECDLVGLGFAFWQSLLGIRRPRHVILQFIMREKTETLASKLKYVLMRFLFSSVHRVICSSSAEADYYRAAFRWGGGKVRFVPFHTDPSFVPAASQVDGRSASERGFVLAAGRSFRDYETAVAAVRGTPFKLVIVGGAGVAKRWSASVQVEAFEEISLERLTALMSKCVAVLVPLQDRKISTGQSLVLQAMAMGKPVIATRTAGTIDYIEHMATGILVKPYDVADLRAAISALVDTRRCQQMGQAARKAVDQKFLPWHYTKNVRAALAD